MLAIASAVSAHAATEIGSDYELFAPVAPFAAGNAPDRAKVDDINGDGHADVVVANRNGDSASLLIGDGNGGFKLSERFSVGDAPFDLALGDFNGDGRPDLAIVNYFDNDIGVLLNVSASTQPCNESDLAAPFGVLDAADITAAIGRIQSADPLGDFDGSGASNILDLLAYLAAFDNGCP